MSIVRKLRGRSVNLDKENVSILDESIIYENMNIHSGTKSSEHQKYSVSSQESFCVESADTSMNDSYILKDVNKINCSEKSKLSLEDINHVKDFQKGRSKILRVLKISDFVDFFHSKKEYKRLESERDCSDCSYEESEDKLHLRVLENKFSVGSDKLQNNRVTEERTIDRRENSCVVEQNEVQNGNKEAYKKFIIITDFEKYKNIDSFNSCRRDQTVEASGKDNSQTNLHNKETPVASIDRDATRKENDNSSSFDNSISTGESPDTNMSVETNSKSIEKDVKNSSSLVDVNKTNCISEESDNSSMDVKSQPIKECSANVNSMDTKSEVLQSSPPKDLTSEKCEVNVSESVNSSLKPSSPLNASALSCKVTEEMIKEEEKMEAEDETELEEVRRKTLEELRRTGQQQRYDRLQVLLNRSNLYATYLLERMREREKIEKKREEKLKEKTKKENTPKSEVKSEEKKKTPRGRKKRKRDSEGSKSENERKKAKVETQENVQPAEEQVSIAELHMNRYINGEIVDTRQPLLITGGIMREYQLDGMSWLRGLFEHGINGILADEMGLGKTIQSIALITSLIENHVIGPYIIVAPLSTLPNWISEFKKFAPEVHAVLYHGSMERRTQLRRKLMRLHKYSHGLRSLPVIVTSYEIAMRDRVPLNSFGYEWKYMIVDEGHRIKNLKCKLIQALKSYRVSNRLLLTGTPLQNNLAELWSLLNFLLPDIFDDLNSFQSWFDFSAMDENEHLFAQEQEAKVLQTLHSILTPFLLRRLKTDVDLSIPPKKEVLVYAPLTKRQEEYYKATLDRTIIGILQKNQKTKEEVVEYSESGRVVRKSRKSVSYKEDDGSQEFDFDKLLEDMENEEKRNQELKEAEKKDKKTVTNIRMQNILMQLRKCVNHPYLIEFPFNAETNELIIDSKLIEASGKLLLLDRMLPALFKQGRKVLLFSQMTQLLDIICDYCDMRSFKYSRIDGTMNVQERQDNIESFNEDQDRNLFLLSTRAGGLGLNLMSADTCIIFDSDWNPQCDLQAQDRCHRIGQKKPVVVFRLVTANTVDERIIERAASKRKLEKMVIHKKNFKGRSFARALSQNELLELLNSKDVNNVVGKSQEVITDEQLEELLDRSDLEALMNNEHKPVTHKTTTHKTTQRNTVFKVLDTNVDEELVF